MTRFRSLALGGLLLSASGLLFAQNFQIRWQTIDGGAGQTRGVSSVIRGTIGQPEGAGNIRSGRYQHSGGFWVGAAKSPVDDQLFADGFE